MFISVVRKYSVEAYPHSFSPETWFILMVFPTVHSAPTTPTPYTTNRSPLGAFLVSQMPPSPLSLIWSLFFRRPRGNQAIPSLQYRAILFSREGCCIIPSSLAIDETEGTSGARASIINPSFTKGKMYCFHMIHNDVVAYIFVNSIGLLSLH